MVLCIEPGVALTLNNSVHGEYHAFLVATILMSTMRIASTSVRQCGVRD